VGIQTLSGAYDVLVSSRRLYGDGEGVVAGPSPVWSLRFRTLFLPSFSLPIPFVLSFPFLFLSFFLFFLFLGTGD
jgi:hypothetical protein